MPIYLGVDRDETRASGRLLAALEGFVAWWLGGPRIHEADLRWSLGTVPRFVQGESNNEGGPR